MTKKIPWIYRVLFLTLLISCTGWVVHRYNFAALPNGGHLLGRVHELMHGEDSFRKSEQKPIIIGHRGVWIGLQQGGEGAGNTLRAIQEAIAIGVDWVEIDVRRSDDGVLFLFHDKDVRRVTDAKCVFPAKDDWDFSSFKSDEIARLGINYKEGREAIPRLAEVLQRFSKDPRVNFVLDIKDPEIKPRELQEAVGELDPKRLILFGRKDCLRCFARKENKSKETTLYTLGYTALWTENNNKFDYLFSHEFFLRKCKELGCEYLVLPALFLNQRLIDEAHEAGLKVLAYGIDEQNPTKVTDMGVDGLIVDDPSGVISKY